MESTRYSYPGIPLGDIWTCLGPLEAHIWRISGCLSSHSAWETGLQSPILIQPSGSVQHSALQHRPISMLNTNCINVAAILRVTEPAVRPTSRVRQTGDCSGSIRRHPRLRRTRIIAPSRHEEKRSRRPRSKARGKILQPPIKRKPPLRIPKLHRPRKNHLRRPHKIQLPHRPRR